jgi:diguanylate cyclase (GGDEF)-like protein/PAS domain S-box-containing protein
MLSLHRLKTRLSLMIALMTLVLALAINHFVGQLNRTQIEQDQSALLEQVATTMMSRLDQDMSTRGGEIKFLAQRDMLKDINVPVTKKQVILDSIRASYPYYAWIGITDTEGNILVGTDGVLVGKSVAKRDWFLLGSQGLHFGDAHDAFLLAKMMPKPKWDDLPLRLVDISAPLYDENNHFLGVICGHLSLDWAFEARNRILDQLSKQQLDLVVLNQDGKVLMGTPELPSLTVDLSGLVSVNQSKEGQPSTQIEQWQDGKRYLTAAVKETGFADYPGMGWTVVARKAESAAFASAIQLSWTIAGLTATGALIFMLIISRVISRQLRPLEQISEAAAHISRNHLSVILPKSMGKDELSVLANNLSDLVTRLQENNAELLLASRVFEDSTQGIIITDTNQKIIRTNKAFQNITGYSSEETVGKNPKILSSGRQDKTFYHQMRDQLGREGNWQGEIWNRKKSGEVYPEWLMIHTLKNEQGDITHYIGIFDDITEKKANEQRLIHLANYDVLTDLPNRHLMQLHTNQLIGKDNSEQHGLALIFIDLDKFKHINDSLGHPVGDQVLLETATRFKQEMRNDYFLARWGGDEFVVVLPTNNYQHISELIKRLIASLQRPFMINNSPHHLSMSAGVALYPNDGQNVEQLLRCADTAMYQAKHEGSNLYRFYEGGMHSDVARFMKIDNALRYSLSRQGQGLQMVFQPQYHTDGNTLLSAEALIRWHDDQLGNLSPGEFIPIAEETGQIVQLGIWVVDAVARAYQLLSAAGCQMVPISINCSARQLVEANLASNVHKILAIYGVPAEHIMIEVTESAVMHNESMALNTLAALRSYGYRISVDDFGTGYACLSYMQKISPAEVKIDQRFIANMIDNDNSRSIVKFTHGLAQSMGIEVVAEGVETAEQLAALTEVGEDIKIQGYLLSKPLVFDDFKALLLAQRGI